MKPQMPKKWYSKLVELCTIQSCSTNEKLMFIYLTDKIQELGLIYKTDSIGNIHVTKGESKTYPCVVAHMDTVHSFVTPYTIYSNKEKNKLFAKSNKSLTGIGGDDKCGIFACLYLLEILPIIKVVFFSKEESGCQGAKNIDTAFFNDCRYLIELDRNGSKDFIDTKLNQKTISHEFSSEVGILKKKYKFKSAEGTITDVVRLWLDGIGISCVNISAGYYDPHSIKEWINTQDLWHSIKFTEKIIQTLKPKIYKSIKKQITTTSYYSYNNYNTKKWCPMCKTMKVKSSGQMTFGSIGSVQTFRCYSCLKADDNYSICKVCYKWVLTRDLQWDTDLNRAVCSSCQKEDNDKGICSICNKPIYIQHAHTVVDDELICYNCYINNVGQDNLDNMKTCSDCNKKVDKLFGKQDGELFICNGCIKKDGIGLIKYSKTDICDNCYSTTKLTKGKYTGNQVKIGNKNIPQFLCNKCYKKMN